MKRAVPSLSFVRRYSYILRAEISSASYKAACSASLGYRDNIADSERACALACRWFLNKCTATPVAAPNNIVMPKGKTTDLSLSIYNRILTVSMSIFGPATNTLKAPKVLSTNPILGTYHNYSPSSSYNPTIGRDPTPYDTSVYAAADKLGFPVGPTPPSLSQEPRLAKKVWKSVYKNPITGEQVDFKTY